jgi:hypothetical protein
MGCAIPLNERLVLIINFGAVNGSNVSDCCRNECRVWRHAFAKLNVANVSEYDLAHHENGFTSATAPKFPNDLSAHLWCLWGTRNSEHIEPDILVSVQKLSPGQHPFAWQVLGENLVAGNDLIWVEGGQRTGFVFRLVLGQKRRGSFWVYMR